MPDIQVEQRFEADAQTVFDVISDHAGYSSLPGVSRAWLRRLGDDCRDGVNAERVIELGPARIVERITEYEPGRALGYRIIESPLPMIHEGARLTFETPAGKHGITIVRWSSRLRSTLPVGRRVAGFAIARQLQAGYAMALRIWARRLG